MPRRRKERVPVGWVRYGDPCPHGKTFVGSTIHRPGTVVYDPGCTTKGGAMKEHVIPRP